MALDGHFHERSHVLVAGGRTVCPPIAIVALFLVHPRRILAPPADEDERQRWRGRRCFPNLHDAHGLNSTLVPLFVPRLEDEVLPRHDKRPRRLPRRIQGCGVEGLLQRALQPAMRPEQLRLESSVGPWANQHRLRVRGVGGEEELHLLPLPQWRRGNAIRHLGVRARAIRLLGVHTRHRHAADAASVQGG